MNSNIGRVIKTSGSSYHISTGQDVLLCSAKGVLKIKSSGIVVGDFVQFDRQNAAITAILPRKNVLIRPSIANIDLINIVISNPPKPDFLMVDKLICTAIYKGINFIITINKAELGGVDIQNIRQCYGDICKIFTVSAATKEGIENLKQELLGKLVCFAGQSAVGKTSIINALANTQNKVGELSQKTNRGKHTTTSTQILSSQNLLLADTPGFSSLFSEVDFNSLPQIFFGSNSNCYFANCKHRGEPDCQITQMVNGGSICSERYERYLTILKELEINYKREYKNVKN